MYPLLSLCGILLMWLLWVLMMILKNDYADLELCLGFCDICDPD